MTLFECGPRRMGIALTVALATSVGVFVSLNASRARPEPLSNTAESPEALAQTVIEAVRAGDVDRLRALAISEEEFRAHVWPLLPAARPGRNVPFDFVWERLQQNSEGHLRGMVDAASGLTGTPPALRDVRFAGEMSRYGDVVVYRRTELVVAADAGAERVIRLFGSTIEQDGRYKVFSYVVGD